MTEINIIEINATLKKFFKLHRIINNVQKVKKIYSYPYKKIGIMKEEYNFYGILNSPDNDWKMNFLARLEFLINELEDIYSDDNIKKGIINNSFSFKSELEFALFCKNNNIKILKTEPKLKTGKKLDLLIQIDSTKILVEVITPRLKAKMVKKNVGFFSISGEIEYNLFGEFKSHEILKNEINQPFFIAIDPIYAGINEIEISCAIEEFNNKFEDISPYLCGIILMNPKRYILLTAKEIGGYQLIKNPNSKIICDLNGLFL